MGATTHPSPIRGNRWRHQHQAVTAGLLAWYRFEDDPSDDDEVLDSSGNGRNGSCTCRRLPHRGDPVGSGWPTTSTESTTTSSSTSSDRVLRRRTAGFTVAFWTFVRGTTGEHAIVSKPFGTQFANSWQVSAFPPDRVRLTVTNMGGSDASPGSLVTQRCGLHYAATWDGTNAGRLYRDGSANRRERPVDRVLSTRVRS